LLLPIRVDVQRGFFVGHKGLPCVCFFTLGHIRTGMQGAMHAVWKTGDPAGGMPREEGF
jgi:hypothetical protein